MDNQTLQDICIEKLLKDKEKFANILVKLPHELQINLLPRLVKEMEKDCLKTKLYKEQEIQQLQYQLDKKLSYLRNSIPNLEILVEFLREVDQINTWNISEEIIGEEYYNIRRQYRKFGKKIGTLESLINELKLTTNNMF